MIHRKIRTNVMQKICAAAAAGTVCMSALCAPVAAVQAPEETALPWNLRDSGYGIGISEAWARDFRGQGVRVALIDSGITATHEDLQGIQIETGYNVIEQTTDVTDHFGHGTQIAGILAADTKNTLGIQGLCDEVTLVPIKCFDSAVTQVKHVVEGIYLAVDTYDCDVINLSLGVTKDTETLRNAVAYAVSKNVIIVAAVGNNGERDPSQILYPAAYEGVIGVGAYAEDGSVCKFSHINSSVDVTAPGDQLITPDRLSDQSYCTVSGTSFAVPHVTAMAVMAKQADPDMTVGEFETLLKQTARDAGAPGYDTSYGYGMVSVSNLVRELRSPPVYSDIRGYWARESIEYCAENGILSGTTDGTFLPENPVTRGMVVMALWRLAGEPTAEEAGFADVPDGAWYETAVNWATEKGIVSGFDAGHFGPEQNVTREQLATILYGFARYSGKDLSAQTPEQYTDWETLSEYAMEPMAWAVTHGIITGSTAQLICPEGGATRGQLAAILHRYLTTFA